MQKFDWDGIVDHGFVDWILEIAGAPTDVAEITAEQLSLLLRTMGGHSVALEEPPEGALVRIAVRLVEDGLREAFADDLNSIESESYILNEAATHHGFEKEITQSPVVCVNWATERELEGLPIIGPVLARRIIEERNAGGPFENAGELAQRVSGLGEKGVEQLMSTLRFRRQPTLQPSPRSLAELLPWLIAKTGKGPAEGLHAILANAIAETTRSLKPRYFGEHRLDRPAMSPSRTCEWIGILEDGSYFPWMLDALNGANSSIDIAMFHVAMPGAKHPTRKLIQALINARRRGVNVRALLDRDRPGEPYKSKVINQEALDVLIQGGVEARFDSEERLLHSKFVILDHETVILGSHNWSAGSYFHYSDASFALYSSELAADIGVRFEALWQGAY